MKKVKLLGMNLNGEEAEVSLCSMVETYEKHKSGAERPFELIPNTRENIDLNYIIQENIATRNALIKVEELLRDVFKEAGANDINLAKLKYDKSVVANGNHAFHSICTKFNSDKGKLMDISKQDLLDKMQSIATNGVLAAEKFGVETQTGLSEVPFRTSFHRVNEEQPITKLKMLVKYTGSDKKSIDNDEIQFFIDFKNPVLNMLKSIDPMHVIERESSDKELYRNLRYSGNTHYMCDDNEAVLKVEAYLRYLYYNRKREYAVKYTEGDGTEQEFIKNKTAKMLKGRTEYAPRIRENYGFILGGVPPQLIVGVKLPEHLRQDEDFVSMTGTMFANAVVFDNKGQILANKCNVIQKQNKGLVHQA